MGTFFSKPYVDTKDIFLAREWHRQMEALGDALPVHKTSEQFVLNPLGNWWCPALEQQDEVRATQRLALNGMCLAAGRAEPHMLVPWPQDCGYYRRLRLNRLRQWTTLEGVFQGPREGCVCACACVQCLGLNPGPKHARHNDPIPQGTVVLILCLPSINSSFNMKTLWIKSYTCSGCNRLTVLYLS